MGTNMSNRREEMDRDNRTKQFRVYFRSDKSSLVSEEHLGTLVKIINNSTEHPRGWSHCDRSSRSLEQDTELVAYMLKEGSPEQSTQVCLLN